jgi:hypothetical protein
MEVNILIDDRYANIVNFSSTGYITIISNKPKYFNKAENIVEDIADIFKRIRVEYVEGIDINIYIVKETIYMGPLMCAAIDYPFYSMLPILPIKFDFAILCHGDNRKPNIDCKYSVRYYSYTRPSNTTVSINSAHPSTLTYHDSLSFINQSFSKIIDEAKAKIPIATESNTDIVIELVNRVNALREEVKVLNRIKDENTSVIAKLLSENKTLNEKISVIAKVIQ